MHQRRGRLRIHSGRGRGPGRRAHVVAGRLKKSLKTDVPHMKKGRTGADSHVIADPPLCPNLEPHCVVSEISAKAAIQYSKNSKRHSGGGDESLSHPIRSYQRPELRRQPPPPRTMLIRSSSTIAPMVALTIAASRPEPR